MRRAGRYVRRWLIVLAVLSGGTPAFAQVQKSATADYSPAPLGTVTQFKCSFNALAATLTQCQAAPAAGLKIYVQTLHIQTTTTTSGTYALQAGTGANCVTGTTAMFPSSGTANRFNAPITTSAMATINFNPPLDLAAATALCVIGVATNTVSGQIEGFIAQ